MYDTRRANTFKHLLSKSDTWQKLHSFEITFAALDLIPCNLKTNKSSIKVLSIFINSLIGICFFASL